ncbi:SDR family NAD(P)-dependent oxidoreductase [Nocardia colli]|uniref:SDR family NAD(P)-dependent oxidoreductase n=1 Tax=Nocardia colli TaxID=2545717 RepID=UPI0021E0EABE|nr:SDR family oxidoreductase [Nocardia colli]
MVAGSTGGVGREVALRLADDGYSVVVCGCDGAGAAETRQLIEWAGGRAVDFVADLGDSVALRRLIAETAGVVAGAPVEVLVNNAGELDGGLTSDMFDVVFRRNVKAPLVFTDAFAPLMAERGRGVIVNVGGPSAFAGVEDGGQLEAAKAALMMLTRLWAVEYGPKGVRVNSVDPRCALTRHGSRPAEVAEAVRFLVSPRAAAIQGTVLPLGPEAGAFESGGYLSAPA